MELKNLEPELLPIDKLPHLRFQVESVERSAKIVLHLNIRKKLLQDIVDSKENNLDAEAQLEMNEKELLIIKTNIELAKTHTDIIKKNEYIKDLRNNLVSVLKEMDEKWSDLIEEAENLKETSKEVAEWLSKIDMAFFDSNWEYAIDFYLNLKHLIYPPTESKKEVNQLSKV
jgi:predicted  nucleic acid-binding Zn-ribbon protein